MIFVALIHDMGKLLTLCGNEPQWSVVGDTYPVGCKYSSKIVFAEEFINNPDSSEPMLMTKTGIYQKHCGFDQLHMSYGHDEYL